MTSSQTIGMLWERDDLATLRSYAREPSRVHRRLPDGTRVEIERWTVRFPPATPSRLPDGVLKKTYTMKPLVAVSNRVLFGELAILSCLELDGWTGVWVDTYHGSELFWRAMPHESASVDLTEHPEALELYRGIVAEHERRGGFFDVFAWRGDDYLFVEFKGKGDKPNANERSWIAAALRHGIKPTQLLLAEYGSPAGTA